MAEGVVGMLILKLGSALAIEAVKFGTTQLCLEAKASSLVRLFGQIRDIKEELESMQSFLQEAERFKDTDKTTTSFIKKIRGLAFEIEDVVDEFTYKLEDNHGGFYVKMNRRFKRIRTWRRLSLKLVDIKLKLENLDRRRARYDIRGIAIEARSSDAHCRSTDQASHFPTEENLVGIDESRNLLIDWLACDSQQESVISTVWGMGGVGKTTLVAHVYNSLKIDFDCAAWITVSKTYQVQDLLKQVIRELQKSDLKGELRVDIVDMEKRSLVEIIRDFLRDLQGAKIRRVPNEVFNMFNLRFLGLRDTEVEELPKTIGRLQKLEVLDVYNAKLLSLPESVATLRKFRYLYVATTPRICTKGVVAWTGFQVPKGIRHLTGLQGLQLVEASSDTLCHLGALTELRTLAITKVRREQCSDLCNAIMNMSHLVSLAIMAINEKETLELEELCLPPTLSKLEIGGQLDKKRMPQIVSSFSDLNNITLLALAFSKLEEDSFSCLLELHGLRALWLDKAYEGKRLHFSAMVFPEL
ncbi:hypothetical protein ACQ4PT_021827 [Festuca glaucescens]